MLGRRTGRRRKSLKGVAMIEELTEDQALNQGLTPFTPPKQKHPREVFELLHFRASTVCVLKLAGYTKSDIARITKLSPPTIDK